LRAEGLTLIGIGTATPRTTANIANREQAREDANDDFECCIFVYEINQENREFKNE
jgi:hypothetical protein